MKRTELIRSLTDDELIEELARRRNVAKKENPIEHWCHDCSHFKTKENCNDTYNPCSKGHRMSFRVPDWDYDDFGFYRRVCPDRDPINRQP